MKKIYRPFLKGTNWALVGLLSLLGFSCDNDSGNDLPAPEYGVPYTQYTIKGKVTDEGGNGIPDIEVRAKTGYDYSSAPYEAGKVKTDAQGKYQMTIDTFTRQTIGVIAEDIDGEINGSFQPDSVFIPKEEIILEGGDNNWFEGEGSKVVDFTLKETEQSETNE